MIAKILDLLSPKERGHAYLLMAMILIMALLDVIGIASIMPFMAVAATPRIVQENAYLSSAFDSLGFTDTSSFLFFLGVLVFSALVISNLFKAITTWALQYFTQLHSYSLSLRLVEGYLDQPYEWHLNRHSADLASKVLLDAQQVVSYAILPLMQCLAQGAVIIAILGLLVIADPELALYLGVALGGAYGGIYAALRQPLLRMGKQRAAANLDRTQILTDAFGGIKEVKLAGLEKIYLARFDGPARRFALAEANSRVAGLIPRYGFESALFGGLMLLLLYLMSESQGLDGALPILALYALAGYRLMPAMQLLYLNITQLRFAGPVLDSLHKDICDLTPRAAPHQEIQPIPLSRAISLEGVNYTYPGTSHPAVKELTLEIPAFSSVGFVGTSGSGKTTTVDIILGLLQPRSGIVRIDDTPLSPADRRNWQLGLGYVPQHIFLVDDTVAANIAYGIQPDCIKQVDIEQAARTAGIHDFIVSELPNGYATLVGERGVRLSGGQRQRIGIARALYQNPQVLVLDEATSALDNLTEQGVMDAVHAMDRKITIILIAHRLTTVRGCDHIYLMEHGQLTAEGTYEELLANNAHFRLMAQAAAQYQHPTDRVDALAS